MNLLLNSKSEMSSQELQLLDSETNKRKKSAVVLWLLWFFLGGFGGHRYYLRNTLYAIFMTITLGLFGIWTLIDAFFIMRRLRDINEQIEWEIINEIANLRNLKNK